MIGLGTRFAALVNVPVLLGAVTLVHASTGLFTPNQGMELSILVLFMLGLVIWHGPGELSVDHWLSKDDRPSPDPQ